jgi:trans-aconitate 2-methyltransferase
MRMQENHDSGQNENSTAKFYDDFSKRQIHVGVNQRHKAILHGLKTAGLKKGVAVLEIGCGIGTLTQLIAKDFKCSTIHATDISPINIEQAKKRLKRFRNLTFQAGDIITDDIKGLYDVIILPDVIEHIPLQHHKTLFNKISGLLKETGFVFINIPQPYLQEWNHQFNPDQLQIIDQAIYTGGLVNNLENSGLYLFSLKTYSIWIKECDYQQMVLKKIPAIHEKSFTRIRPKIKFWKWFKIFIRSFLRK